MKVDSAHSAHSALSGQLGLTRPHSAHSARCRPAKVRAGLQRPGAARRVTHETRRASAHSKHQRRPHVTQEAICRPVFGGPSGGAQREPKRPKEAQRGARCSVCGSSACGPAETVCCCAPCAECSMRIPIGVHTNTDKCVSRGCSSGRAQPATRD